MSLEEIAFNLSKYGFINNGKQWLGAKKKSIEGLNDEICFIINRCTALNCSSIYPNSIFNNQSFKEERGRESRKSQRGINFKCFEVD